MGFASTAHRVKQARRRRSARVVLYDVGGGATIRGIWQSYYAEVPQAVLYAKNRLMESYT
jgi:hypothetical protein